MKESYFYVIYNKKAKKNFYSNDEKLFFTTEMKWNQESEYGSEFKR